MRVILCRKEPRFIFAACRTCPYDYGSSVCLEQVQYDCLGGLYYWNPYEDKCKMNGMNIFILGKGSKKKKKKVMEFSITSEGTPPPSKVMEYIFLFILYMGSKKCFNAKNFFYITFSHKIQDLGRVSTKKGIVSDGGGVTKG